MSWPVEELTYDVSTQLAGLEPLKNAEFSASCAERLMPLYQKFCVEQHWDHELQLREALSHAWNALREPSGVDHLEGAISRLEALVPHADDFDSPLITAAQDCAICTDLAVRWLLGRQALPSASPQYALEGIASAEAARRTGILSFGSTPDDEVAEKEILGLPAVQNELAYQRQDIETLLATREIADVAEEMCLRARGNAHR